MKWIYYLSIVCVVVQLSSQDEDLGELAKCFPLNKSTLLSPKELLPGLTQSRLQFSLEFMKNVFKKSKPGSNVFFSPHSVYQALLLTLFISDGETEKNIKTALRIPHEIDKLEVLRMYTLEAGFEKMRALNASANYEFNNVNKFFYENDLPVRECMKMVFKEELESLNFKYDPFLSKQIINEWVSNQTKYQINDLLSDSDVHEDTKLILVNAMYFKGLWQSKFLPENTKKEIFHSSPSKKTFVQMMKQKGNFKYLISEKLGIHAVQLPYKGEDISMFILLPPFVEQNSIEFLLRKLTPEMISEIVEPNYMVERPVELGVPKFTVEHKLDGLVPILEAMGVGDLFRNSSNLSALTGGNEVSFNDVVHKAKVSIDEQGTVAAASTAMFTFRSSRPLEPISFICNHPFLYFLYDNVSQTILFMGVYNSPA